MIARIPLYVLRFFALVIVQALIIRNIELGKYATPFIYILFIFFLPIDTPGLVLLLASFFLGMLVDMFYDTMGMHTAASVFTAFCRPAVLKFISPREAYEDGTEPSISQFGLAWYISYAGTLIFIHHFVLFFIEKFNFSGFFFTFLKIISSGLCSLVLIIVIQFLFYKNKN